MLKQFQKSTINDQDHDRIDGRNVVDDNRCVGDSFEMLMIESLCRLFFLFTDFLIVKNR